MAGTVNGAKQAAETNRRLHGSDFYKRIGALGGAKSRTGGFACQTQGKDGLTGPERASLVGQKGGRVSRRRKNETV